MNTKIFFDIAKFDKIKKFGKTREQLTKEIVVGFLKDSKKSKFKL